MSKFPPKDKGWEVICSSTNEFPKCWDHCDCCLMLIDVHILHFGPLVCNRSFISISPDEGGNVWPLKQVDFFCTQYMFKKKTYFEIEYFGVALQFLI